MPVVVQKYGGSSVANEESIRRVARQVAATRDAGKDVVVVVSAMGDTTDHLLSLARQVSRRPHGRELDMLVTAGERISIALLCMAICDLGHEAISFTGSQSGIITNDSHNRARIVEVRPHRISDELDRGRIVVVAGYQGVSYRREITSLGRGGTDATAVALAAALGAEACEIYSDVDGVYTADPRVVLDARKLEVITHDEMLALSRHGARVMNADAVAYARAHGIALYARATGSTGEGTFIRLHPPEPPALISGVTAREDRTHVRVAAADTPLNPLDLLDAFDAAGLCCDHLQASGGDRGAAAALFSAENHPDLDDRLAELSLPAGATVVDREPVATVTVVGHALPDDPALMRRIAAVVRGSVPHPRAALLEPLAATFVVDRGATAGLTTALHAAVFGGPPVTG